MEQSQNHTQGVNTDGHTVKKYHYVNMKLAHWRKQKCISTKNMRFQLKKSVVRDAAIDTAGITKKSAQTARNAASAADVKQKN
jgi:hypothetical protein